jgi:hypothetical protein
MIVGPFTLVPDSDPGIVVSFGVFNFGAGYDNATAAYLRNKIRDTLAGARASGHPDDSFVQPTANEATGPQLKTMQTLNSSEFPWNGCDGPLAADCVVLPNHGPGDTIATTTNGGQAWQLPMRQMIYEGSGLRGGRSNSPRSSGCRDSKYGVALNVERISKP